jgi:hypothetical protein
LIWRRSAINDRGIQIHPITRGQRNIVAIALRYIASDHVEGNRVGKGWHGGAVRLTPVGQPRYRLIGEATSC